MPPPKQELLAEAKPASIHRPACTRPTSTLIDYFTALRPRSTTDAGRLEIPRRPGLLCPLPAHQYTTTNISATPGSTSLASRKWPASPAEMQAILQRRKH